MWEIFVAAFWANMAAKFADGAVKGVVGKNVSEMGQALTSGVIGTFSDNSEDRKKALEAAKAASLQISNQSPATEQQGTLMMVTLMNSISELKSEIEKMKKAE